MQPQRIQVHYRLSELGSEPPEAAARRIALEQTVELPDGCYPDPVEQAVVGRLERSEPGTDRGNTVTISYDTRIIGSDPLQLINLLFGNISLQRGIRLEAVDWPPAFLGRWPGPRFGLERLRRRCGVARRRPLLCTALKPMGLDARQLARICGDFARGGADLVKDDHGLADQATAPFEDRVLRCQEAVQEANRETGRQTLYAPHLTAGPRTLEERLDWLRRQEVQAVLVCPLLLGVDRLARLARRGDLAILAHPSLTGALFAPDHGMAPDLLLGQVFRMLGSDVVIYPNVGGRFPLDEATCHAINRRLREPLGSLLPAFPAPAGGIDAATVPGWCERYGPDTVFLIGGSLYATGDLVGATSRLARSLEESVTD